MTVDVNTSLASGGEWGSLSGPEIGEIDRAWKRRIVQESDDDAAAGGLESLFCDGWVDVGSGCTDAKREITTSRHAEATCATGGVRGLTSRDAHIWLGVQCQRASLGLEICTIGVAVIFLSPL